MRKSRFTEAQIIGMIKEQEAGMPTAEVISVTTYAVAGLIDWGNLLIVGLSCAMGGYIGAVLARRVRNTAVLRLFIIAIGLIMAVAFFMRPAG